MLGEEGSGDHDSSGEGVIPPGENFFSQMKTATGFFAVKKRVSCS